MKRFTEFRLDDHSPKSLAHAGEPVHTLIYP